MKNVKEYFEAANARKVLRRAQWLCPGPGHLHLAFMLCILFLLFGAGVGIGDLLHARRALCT